MTARSRVAAWLGAVPVVLLVSGCAVSRTDSAGVYRSSKGYHVQSPGEQWTPVAPTRADVELRHRSSSAAIAANAVCDPATVGRPTGALARQLSIGLRDRQVIERGEIEIAGRPAVHDVVDGRLEDSDTRLRIETLVLKDERCVYDLMYAAPPAVFPEHRADFGRFVESFRTE